MTSSPLKFPPGFSEHGTYVQMGKKELLLAAVGGVMREIQDMLKHREHKWACDNDRGWGNHIDGCIGELALARSLDRFWSPGKVGGADLEQCNLEVRARRGEKASLILHPGDHDDRIYVLTWLHWEYVVLAGWMRGHEGKDQKYWRTQGVRHPAFFIPHDELQSIAALRGAMDERSAPEVAW